MKRFAILLLLIGFALANVDASVKIVPLEGSHVSDQYRAPRLPSSKTTLIGAVGDTRTILGPTAKNIVVSKNGEAIGIMYCPPSSPYNGQEAFGEVRIAYSLDMGATFTNYGPFNGLAPLRRTYPGIDGSKDFDTQAGELFFAWQEGPAGYPSCDGWMAIEENLPSSPSFSTPQKFGDDVWILSICVDPDDPLHVMITYWDYLPSGNNNNYIVHSTDGGYTWGDTILVAEAIGSWISSGHLRMGMDDYAFFTYHDTYTGVEYPYYTESTDAGYTWATPATLPALTSTQQWWHEYDCEVVKSLEGNNFPMALHNDLTDQVMGLYFPNPDNPGSAGAWNWQALNVSSYTGETYQGTTWAVTPIQYPTVCFNEDLNVILVSFKANFTISPSPAGWTDGNYLGGIVSIDGGRSWRACRPMSGPLLQVAGGSTESAHQLVWLTPPYTNYTDDTIWVLTTWEDADDAVAGNQYFEIGAVLPINLDNWVPGIAENGQGDVVTGIGLVAAPTIINNNCRISFNMPRRGTARLRLFDIAGRLVDNVFSGSLETGAQTIDLGTSGLANGVYIVSLETPAGNDAAKIVINR